MSEESMDESVTTEADGEQPAEAAPEVGSGTSENLEERSEPGQTEAQASSSVPMTSSSAAIRGRGRRKMREGIARSVSMDKTVVVEVIDRVRHPRYGKTVQRSRNLYVHDEANEVRSGDRVRVAETRPLSKTKRWRVVEIVERAR
jgi:small subunit ribosomal protein S17